MLVILMLSTIALFTMPNLSSWLHKNQVEVAAQDFLSYIAYARQQAITLRNPVVLCRTDHTGQCSMPTQYDPHRPAAAQNWGEGYAIRIHPSTSIAPWFGQALRRIWQSTETL
jgi:Tfp pilus assembly protein FimT